MNAVKVLCKHCGNEMVCVGHDVDKADGDGTVNGFYDLFGFRCSCEEGQGQTVLITACRVHECEEMNKCGSN